MEDLKYQAEQIYKQYYETMTIEELLVRQETHRKICLIAKDKWGNPTYDYVHVCVVCGVHTNYSYGHEPPVYDLFKGQQIRLKGTYCGEHYQAKLEYDHCSEVIDLRKHHNMNGVPLNKESIINKYREHLGMVWTDTNRCLKCANGQACLKCSSAINGHSNVYIDGMKKE